MVTGVKTTLGIQRIVLPLEPYEPFGFRNKEDINAGRFFFINRKQDRFTVTCNYREHGVTKNSKKYGRFKKLFSFTITLREPKTLNRMSLNVFYHGNIGGRKYNLLNITRNPSLVLGAFPSDLNNLILDETISLIKRQKYVTPAQLTNIKNKINQFKQQDAYSSLACMKLIQYLSCPVVRSEFNNDASLLSLNNIKTQRNNFEALILPAFVMPYIRNTNIDNVFKQLNIYETNIEYVKKHIKQLNINALYYLNITKGLIDETTQTELLQLLLEEDSPEYSITSRSWDANLNGSYIKHLRQALKTLPQQARNKVLLDPEFIDYAPRIIKIWLGRSKFEKKFTIKETINNVKDFYYHLIEYLNERKIEVNTITPNSIISPIKKLQQGEVFQDDDSLMKATVGTFGSIKIWLPKDAQNSGTYQTWFRFDEVKKDSPLWKPIFDDDAFIKTPSDLVGFYNRVVPDVSQNMHIVFSPKVYAKFLQTLDEVTTSVMRQHDIDDNVNNRAFVSLIVLAFYSCALPHFRKLKRIPNKIFTLYKKGLHVSIIEFALYKKIPETVVEEYVGIPLEWAEKMLGAKEGSFGAKEYIF